MSACSERPIAAAIDIGSNSIKMTIGRPDDSGGIDQFDWASEVVRLGQGLEESGRLDERRIDAAVATLGRFAARAHDLGAGVIVAVATEATRAAANAPAFLERVRRATDIDVRILSGLEEAALTFRGLSATTDVSGRVVVADIGGGSTELIVAHDGVVQAARSLPLGSGRLTERFIHADPPAINELAASEASAAAMLEPVAESLGLPWGDDMRLVIVGGTGEFMVRLIHDPALIDQATVRAVLGKLAVLTAAELADAIDVPEARARVLPAGVAIVAAIANRVRPHRIDVAQSGIRVGLLADLFAHWACETVNGAGPEDPAVAERGAAKSPARGSAVDEPEFRESMKMLIAERWGDVLLAIPAAIAGVDSAGVHDVRVASRRLRAAMDVAAPLFPAKWFRPMQHVAKQITRALGEVRDRDVLLEALQADRTAAALAEHPGIDRLIARIERERALARAEMESYLRELTESGLAESIAHRFGPVPARSLGHATTQERPG